MSAQAGTNCHDIFNIVAATRTHLAKIGAKCHVVPTCRDMSATFRAKAAATITVSFAATAAAAMPPSLSPTQQPLSVLPLSPLP